MYKELGVQLNSQLHVTSDIHLELNSICLCIINKQFIKYSNILSSLLFILYIKALFYSS